MKFILGKKIGMSQKFDSQGRFIPVTLVEAGPCWITQLRTPDKEGYQAVQLGFEEVKEKKVKKPQRGQLNKNDLNKYFRYLREFAVSSLEGKKTGQKIDVSIFVPGEKVKVSGLSKGKGFQGVVKRHGFAGGPASHGGRHNLRTPGSIGSAFPERVVKGKKMAGHMGVETKTVPGLEIVDVDKENNLLAIKGALPGRKRTFLKIVAIKEIEQVQEEEQEKLEEITRKKEKKEEAQS